MRNGSPLILFYRLSMVGLVAVGCTASTSPDPASKPEALNRCAPLAAVATGAIGQIESEYARWSDFLLRVGSESQDVAAQVDQYRQTWGVPLSFWAGSSFRRVGLEFPAFVWDRPESFRSADVSAYIDENVPCGPAMTMFVKRLPLEDLADVYATDEVHEIEESGETIRRWRVPRDYLVRGISGTELLIPYRLYPRCASGGAASGFPVWVDLAILPGGSFRVAAAHEAAGPAERYECGNVPAFSNSAYLKCEILRDLATGRRRRIASESPCT